MRIISKILHNVLTKCKKIFIIKSISTSRLNLNIPYKSLIKIYCKIQQFIKVKKIIINII